jgi:hypothetical protein
LVVGPRSFTSQITRTLSVSWPTTNDERPTTQY